MKTYIQMKAVRNIHPNVVRTIGDESFDVDGNIVVLDQSLIDAEIIKLQAEYDALQYQRDRKPEYPSIADQLDYIYHNGIAKWKSDMVKPVKDAHPKP